MRARGIACACACAWAACGEPDETTARFDVTGVAPARISARGGEVKLFGGRFPEGAAVHVGGAPAAVISTAEGEIEIEVAPRLAGRVDVRVAAPDGRIAELEDALEIVPLELTFETAPPYLLPELAGLDVRSATAADADGDGRDEVLIATDGGARVLASEGGKLVLATTTPTAAWAPGGIEAVADLEAADLDGDGAMDLFLCGARDRVVWGPLSAAGTEVADRLSEDDAEPCHAAAAGDLDGDGDLDLALLAGGDAPLRIHRNERGRAFTSTTSPWSSPVRAVDLSISGAHVLVLGEDGALWSIDPLDARSERFEAGSGAQARALRVFDADGDGDDDAFITFAAAQDRLLVNDGHGRFFDGSAAALPVDRADGTTAAAADLDRDGALDLIIGNDGQTDRLYQNRGSGRFADRTPSFALQASRTQALAVIDVDRDGDLDVLSLGPQVVLRVLVERDGEAR